ncbi:MAG TPA: glycosyltransferase [Solirubrobacteraceae bacterium]|nr:glycosyltransferase [Solirubrobacteraceae bacterium]
MSKRHLRSRRPGRITGERRHALKFVFLGLSITSSWGNTHATNYRALVGELATRGHEVLFCERAAPWYESSRDLEELADARLFLYGSVDELAARAHDEIAAADLVIVGSRVPEGVAVAELVLGIAEGRTAFYDIDTPLTLAKLQSADHEYLTPELVPQFDLYLSHTGGPTLQRLETEFGARHAVAFHCVVDPRRHIAVASRPCWDLGYLGGYSADRQPGLDSLLLAPARALRARRFVVAGPEYPEDIAWPANVARIQQINPARHSVFYGAQRFTLNLTREPMRETGWSPSVRLFEAAACGTAIITDEWPGLEDFFTPDEDILVARSADEVLLTVVETDARTRQRIASRARQRVLSHHTAARRIDQLEQELASLAGSSAEQGTHEIEA